MEYVFVSTLVGVGYYIQTLKNTNSQSSPSSDLTTSFNKNIFESSMVESSKKAQLKNAEQSYADDIDISTTHAGNKSHDSKFTHSNMEPFFGAAITQNMNPNANSSRLQNTTGRGMFMPEKSVEPMFQPSAQESITKDMLNTQYIETSRMNPSTKNTSVLPFQQIQVGKGLGQGFGDKPSTGYHPLEERQYQLPKSIDELRSSANKKVVYEGRTVRGKNIIDKRGEQPDMMKYLPDRDFANGPERYLRTTGISIKPEAHSQVILKETKKELGAYSVSNATQGQKEMIQRDQENAPLRKNLFTTNGPRNNSAAGQWTDLSTGDYGYKSIAPTISNITEKRSALANLVSAVKAIIAPINDTMKITKREGMSKNAHMYNNKKGENRITLQMEKDSIKTTLREVIQSHYQSNVSGPKEMYTYDPDDIARKTRKEETATIEYTGNAKNSTSNPPSHESMNNAEFNELREFLETNRDPTPSNVTLVNGKDSVHITKEGNCLPETNREESRNTSVNMSQNAYPSQTKSKTQYQNLDRFDTSLLSSLDSNPLNVSITAGCSSVKSKESIPSFYK